MKDTRLVIEVSCEGRNGLKPVGEIICNSASSYAFKYDENWLANEDSFVLEPRMSDTGWYYSSDGLFPFMRDCMPDRWGCRLIDRALESKDDRLLDLQRRTSSYGDLFYFLAVDDNSRLGALRYKIRGDKTFAGDYGITSPLLLDELGRLSYRFSDRDYDVSSVLFIQGSSMGGARPKAVLRLQDELWLAKFSSKKDEYNVPCWEYVNLLLANDCGLDVPDFRLERLQDGKNVLLLKRFDREGERRLHFVSCQTLLHATERERRGYAELAAEFESNFDKPRESLHELWKRAVFNVLVTNTDDHLKNHAILWKPDCGWLLSPLYDLESTPPSVSRDRIWCMGLFSGSDRELTVRKLFDAHEYFNVSKDEALQFLRDANNKIPTFKYYASKYGISSREIQLMSGAYLHADREISMQLAGQKEYKSES